MTRYKIQYAKEIPNDAEGRHPIIILDRISPIGALPDYCVHGRVRCYRCDHWCYLGTSTHDYVLRGAHPICEPCGLEIAKEHPDFDWEANRIARAEDHRREDGPHE